jgi:UDP-glucose 4-epimerase
LNEIIVLGNSGFIGRNIFSSLYKKYGERVIGFSSKSCNLLDIKSITNAFSQYQQDVTYIITSGITRLQGNSRVSFFDNITMIDNFINVIQGYVSVRQIIFLSTIDVYGNSEKSEIISELTPINPSDYYSLSKYVIEFMLQDYCTRKSIPLTILRLTGVFGSHDKTKSTVNKMINSAFSQKKIIVFGDGEDTRDFIYVKDLTQIIANCLDLNLNKTINIASGQSNSITTYAHNILTAIKNPEIKIEYVNNGISGRRKYLEFDISLFKKIFPHFSFMTFPESIQDYLKEYQYESN